MITITIPNKLGIEVRCETSTEAVELLLAFGNRPAEHLPIPKLPTQPAPSKPDDASMMPAHPRAYIHKLKKDDKTVPSCFRCSKKLRSDSSPCPRCHRMVCSKCRIFSHGKICRDCLAGGNEGTGAPASKKHSPMSNHARRKSNRKPSKESAIQCESCSGEQKNAVKCTGCEKMIRGSCARRFNGQCEECASTP
jgi:hypothetical protein